MPELSVAENIFLGRLPLRRRFGVVSVDWQEVFRQAASLLHDMGLDLDPHMQVARLSIGQQQVVEIAKAMAYAPLVLLLDEPTSALATKEAGQLFALLHRLKQRGVTMIYITHRMPELFQIADTCTVLRDGRPVGSIDMPAATTDSVVEMMFGDIARATWPPRQQRQGAEPILTVDGLTRPGVFENVSFTLHRAEVLGLAGMLGSGRSEMLRAIFGADPFASGSIVFNGSTQY